MRARSSGEWRAFQEVGAALGIEPEIWGIAEDASEDEGGGGAAVSAQFAGDARGVGQSALGEGVGVEEFPGEDVADGGGFAGLSSAGLAYCMAVAVCYDLLTYPTLANLVRLCSLRE